MPYEYRNDGYVYNQATGKRKNKTPLTRERAMAYMRALYAAEGRTKEYNPHAKAGETISGRLKRGGDGKFSSGGDAPAKTETADEKAKRIIATEAAKPTPPKAGGRRAKLKARKAPKPKQTDEQKRQAHEAKKAEATSQHTQQQAKSHEAIATALTGKVDPVAFTDLMDFAGGKDVNPAKLQNALAQGLLEQGTDGTLRLSAAGRGLKQAADRGDVRQALDSLSKGHDAVARTLERQAKKAGLVARKSKPKQQRQRQRAILQQRLEQMGSRIAKTEKQSEDSRKAMFAKMGGGKGAGQGYGGESTLWTKNDQGKRTGTSEQQRDSVQRQMNVIDNRIKPLVTRQLDSVRPGGWRQEKARPKLAKAGEHDKLNQLVEEHGKLQAKRDALLKPQRDHEAAIHAALHEEHARDQKIADEFDAALANIKPTPQHAAEQEHQHANELLASAQNMRKRAQQGMDKSIYHAEVEKLRELPKETRHELAKQHIDSQLPEWTTGLYVDKEGYTHHVGRNRTNPDKLQSLSNWSGSKQRDMILATLHHEQDNRGKYYNKTTRQWEAPPGGSVNPTDYGLFFGTKSFDEPLVTTYKSLDGRPRWLSVTTTAFKDRQAEILSTFSLEQDVARSYKSIADGRATDHGPLLFWHTPIELGRCDWRAVSGHSLIESGYFHSEKEARIAKPTDQMSPGFYHSIIDPDPAGIFHYIITEERSITPQRRAANPYTLITKEAAMPSITDEKAQEYLARGGDPDLLTELLEKQKGVEANLLAAGVAHKDDSAAADPATEEDDLAEDAADSEALFTPDDFEVFRPMFTEVVTKALAPIVGLMDVQKTMAGHVQALQSGYAKKEAEQQTLAEQIAALQRQNTDLAARVKELEGDIPEGVKRAPVRASEAINTLSGRTKEASVPGPASDGGLNFFSDVPGMIGVGRTAIKQADMLE